MQYALRNTQFLIWVYLHEWIVWQTHLLIRIKSNIIQCETNFSSLQCMLQFIISCTTYWFRSHSTHSYHRIENSLVLRNKSKRASKNFSLIGVIEMRKIWLIWCQFIELILFSSSTTVASYFTLSIEKQIIKKYCWPNINVFICDGFQPLLLA